MRTIWRSVALLVLAAGAAQAVSIPVTIKKLVVLDKVGVSGRAKTVYVSTDRWAGITKGTGTDEEQISVRLDISHELSSTGGAFVVPAGASDGTAGWVLNRDDVAKFENTSAPAGPTEARTAVIKPGKLLKLAGKGLGDVPVDLLGLGAPVYTAYCVTNGGEEFCHCSGLLWWGCAYKSIAGGIGAKVVCSVSIGDPACKAICYTPLAETVLDTCTGVEWEKKDGYDGGAPGFGGTQNAGDPHDVDNLYSWAGRCSLDVNVLCQPNLAAAATCAAQTGGAVGCDECDVSEGVCDATPLGGITTIWDWLSQLNAANFAGHADWRVPPNSFFPDPTQPDEVNFLYDPVQHYDPEQLLTLVRTHPVFRPSAPKYWTASTQPGATESARYAGLEVGSVSSAVKPTPLPVRAVR